MGITVSGPGGITVEFPDGTDSATIRGVMDKAHGVQRPDAGPSKPLLGTNPYDAPTAGPSKPWLGTNPYDAPTAAANGFNKGLAQVITAPYRAVDWLGEKAFGGGFLPNAEDSWPWRPMLNPRAPESRLGDYAQSAGEAVGGSVVPAGVMMGLASRAAGPVARSTIGQIGQSMVQNARANPGQFLATDIASAASGGVAQQGAADAGAAPWVQGLAGMAGGMAPGIAAGYRTPSNQPVGSPTAQGIARQRAIAAQTDAQAFDNQGIRPFGPSFNQGPVASVGKQLTETPLIGAPLRNNMDETFHDTAAAAQRLATQISPNATAEGAGQAVQGGLDRFRARGFNELEPGQVQALGINPVQPVNIPQGGGQAQMNRIAAAQPGIQQVTGGSVQNSRGNPVGLPQTRVQKMTNRTSVEDLSDTELNRVIRVPAQETSFAARQEALYEKAFRGIPPIRRSDGSVNPLPLPTANSGAVVRQMLDTEARSSVTSGLATGRFGPMLERLANARSNVSFGDLRVMRTEIGRELNNFGLYDVSLDRTQLRRLYAGISSDLEVGLQDIAARAVAAHQAGGNTGLTQQQTARAVQALRDFQVADRYTRQSMDRMDRFMQVVRAENPQQAAANLIRSASDGLRGNERMFRAAMGPLRPEERAQFGALVVQELGRPINSARGLVQEAGFSPSSFVTRYTAMSPASRALIFTPDHQDALQDLYRVANRLANVEAMANTSRSGTNALNLGALAGAGSSVARGDVATPLAIAGSGYAASVLMSMPKYTRWMTGYLQLRASISDGSHAAAAPLVRHVLGLEQMARYNPELWPVFMAVAHENGINTDKRLH